MSYYFVKMSITTRTGGGSALRRSAYQRCTRDPDFDFSHKADELVDHEVMLPKGADPAFKDPVKLWSAVEAKENRVNSQFCRTFEISIPNEVPHALRADFARELMQPFIDHGVAVEWAIHTEAAIFQDVENPHISAMVGIRQFDENGGWKEGKDRSMNNVMRDEAHQKFWVPAMNEFFKKHGIEAHVSHENSHMPVASAKVRRMAKAWKRKGADPEKMPPALAQFMDHRKAYLKRQDEELDLMAEIETLEKEMEATSKENITEESNDDRHDARADRGTGNLSRGPDDREPAAGPDEPGRVPEPAARAAATAVGDDPVDEERHLSNLGTDPAERRKSERRSHVGSDDRDIRSDASDRRDADSRQREDQSNRRSPGRTQRSSDEHSRLRLKRRITVNQTSSLMKQVRDALPEKPKETRLLDRLRRNQVVRSTSDHMKRIKNALKLKQATPLHKIKRVQAVQATDEKMTKLRKAANAREEEIQLIDDEDPRLERANARRSTRALGHSSDAETQSDRSAVADRPTGERTAGTDSGTNTANVSGHADQNSQRNRSTPGRSGGHKGHLETARGRVKNNKLKDAAKGSSGIINEANGMANDSPTISPPLDPNDPTWASKALQAWSNGHHM